MRRALSFTVLLSVLGCRTVTVAPPEPPVEFLVFERLPGGGVIEHGTVLLPGGNVQRGWAVRPLDESLDVAAIARVLRGSNVTGLSLAGWPRVDGLEVLCDAAPLEWLDLSRNHLGGTLRSLSKCTHLRALVVDQARVTDESLATLPPLRSLDARETALGDAALAVVSAWPALEELGLSKTQVTDAAMPALAKRSATLTRLELADTDVGPVGVRALAPLVALRVLDLGATAVTDDALVVLEGFEQLESLSLANTVTSDAGLEHLRKLARLTSLNLSETRITDAGLAGLESATHLEALLLSSTAITDVTGKRLAPLKALRLLDLGETKVTNETARVVGTLVALEELSLSKTDIDDFGVSAMRPLVALRLLDLEKTQVSSTSLSVIGGFVKLRSLDLSSDLLHDAKFADLSSLTELDTLRVANSFLSSDALRELPNAARLKTLDLSGLPVTDVEAQWLAKNAPRLELLKLNFTKVGDSGLEALSALTELRRIDLGRSALSDRGLASLLRAPKLVSLDLGLCTAVTAQGFAALANSKLESVFLAGTNADDSVVRALPKSVRTLGLMKTKVTRAVIPAMVSLPGLREVDVRELGWSDEEVKPLHIREVVVRN